jgi:hypothetical protein
MREQLTQMRLETQKQRFELQRYIEAKQRAKEK